jgi:OOP family OmpA-OmpF porin
MKNKLFTTSVKWGAAVAVLLTTGCAEYHRRVLETTQARGSEFTKTLADEYGELGKTEENIMYDQRSADEYYLKAIAAKDGLNVQPTLLEEWSIDADKLPELVTAREILMKALHSGAREYAPKMAAHAQAHFDCWVEQEAEEWQKEDIARCRSEFYMALSKVELMLMGGVSKAEPHLMVLFDLNTSYLNAEAMKVIEEVVLAAKAEGASKRILLVGRTDRVGDLKHNKHLAQNRAMRVKNELVRKGIPSHSISIEAAGETAGPKVDAHNRRVDIIFVKYK